MICQPVRGHKHHTGGCLKMVSMRVFRLMAALFFLVFPAAGPAPCHEWIQPEPGQPPRWGHPDGLSISLHPTPGPRGLIRLHAPHLGQTFPRVINFVSLEPVAGGRRYQSELERSADGNPGLRFTSGDTLEDALRATPTGPNRGVVEKHTDHEILRLFIASERMPNGAHPAVEARFDSRSPHSVTFRTLAGPDSAPMASLVLSATMGNYARLRRVWLAKGPVHARDLWGDYRPDRLNFAPWRGWKLDELTQQDGLARVAWENDEDNPAQADYAPGVSPHWRYQGKKATQLWETRAVPGLEARVNARKTYWGESGPIPGGISFENCELEAPFRPGAEFTFTVSPRTPADLGFRNR